MEQTEMPGGKTAVEGPGSEDGTMPVPVIVAAAVFFSHMVEAITGFGCMILALPFVGAALGLQKAVPVLVILSTVFDLVLVIQGRRQVRWKTAFFIAAVTAVSMPVGFFALKNFPEETLMRALGIFIIAAALLGLLRRSENTTVDPKRVLFLPLAGIVQGAFGGSGPFIVLYSQQVLRDKTVFRSTMALVWVLLNTINLVQYGLGGMLTADVFRTAGWLIPCLALGLLVGEAIHRKINAKVFSAIIYGILIVTGITMLV